MYGLPPSTEINRPLHKKAIFEKFNLKSVERDHFDEDISKMSIVAYLSPSKIPALHEGQEIKEFYVLQIQLKHRDYDVKNIIMMNKLIPQHILFALEYEGSVRFCIYHTRLLQSDWHDSLSASVPISGISLDAVWNNIVAEIGNLDNSSVDSLEQQIINREEKEKLLKQIELLEKRCRIEKQTRKKYDLHQQLLKLKEQL